MKLFENGVGRPSNEIKKKRKIFIVSAIVLSITLISSLIFVLFDFNIDILKGASSYLNESNTAATGKITSIWCGGLNTKTCKDKNMNLNVSNKGKYALYYTTVTCSNLNDCTKSNAWDDAKSRNKTSRKSLNNGDVTIYFDETLDKIEDRNFYVRFVTYIENKADTWTHIYVYRVAPTLWTTSGTNRWITESTLVYHTVNTKIIPTANPTTKSVTTTKPVNNSGSVVPTTKPTTTTMKTTIGKQMTLSCQDSRTVGNPVTCYVTSNGKALTGTKVTVPFAATATIKNIKTNKYTVTFNDLLFTNYKDQIKTDKNGKKYITAKVEATKSGYKRATDIVKIYEDKTLKIDSWIKNITIGETVNVSVFSSGLSFAGAKLSAADSSVMTSKDLGNGSYSITFNNKLFTKYKKQIKKDGNGNEYIKAKITATKSGYTSKSITINVYKTKFAYISHCTELSRVGEPIICIVSTDLTGDPSGFKLTAADSSVVSNSKYLGVNSLGEARYEIVFNNKLFTKYSKQIKKTASGNSYIEAKITASKKGFRTSSIKTPIYIDEIVLNCDKNVSVGTELYCHSYSNGKPLDGVLVTAADALTTIETHKETHAITFWKSLFEKYPKQVKKDSLGNKYIEAKLTATKENYLTTSTLIKVYENKYMPLNCDSTIKLEKTAVCSIAEEGVTLALAGSSIGTIRVSSPGVYTIDFDKKLFTKYSKQVKKDSNGKYISVSVKAFKPGFQTVNSYIKVYK